MSWLIKETLFLIKNFFDLQGIKKADLFASQHKLCISYAIEPAVRR
ncbi:hypothetical protein QRY05_17150 [Enterococcus gallinarum]|nr:hypothetical protein [Enterococcus gallinarum]